MIRILVLLAGLSLSVFAIHPINNTNGGFEYPVGTGRRYGHQVSPWLFEDSSIEDSVAAYEPVSGSQYVAVGDYISREFRLSPGIPYLLTWFDAGRSSSVAQRVVVADGDSSYSISVLKKVGKTLIASTLRTTVANSRWGQQYFLFTVKESNTYTIKFKNLDASDDFLIDEVTLSVANCDTQNTFSNPSFSTAEDKLEQSPGQSSEVCEDDCPVAPQDVQPWYFGHQSFVATPGDSNTFSANDAYDGAMGVIQHNGIVAICIPLHNGYYSFSYKVAGRVESSPEDGDAKYTLALDAAANGSAIFVSSKQTTSGSAFTTVTQFFTVRTSDYFLLSLQGDNYGGNYGDHTFFFTDFALEFSPPKLYLNNIPAFHWRDRDALPLYIPHDAVGISDVLNETYYSDNAGTTYSVRIRNSYIFKSGEKPHLDGQNLRFEVDPTQGGTGFITITRATTIGANPPHNTVASTTIEVRTCEIFSRRRNIDYKSICIRRETYPESLFELRKVANRELKEFVPADWFEDIQLGCECERQEVQGAPVFIFPNDLPVAPAGPPSGPL